MNCEKIPDTIDLNSELLEAWKSVSIKTGTSVGVDGITIEKFRDEHETNLKKLAEELECLKYKPLPAIRIYIPKRSGGDRAIHVLCVRDRVVQTFLNNQLNKIIDPNLSDVCHSYRSGRSVKSALENVAYFRSLGFIWTLESDIKSFFDSICHTTLLRKLHEICVPKWLIDLVEKSIKIDIYDGESIIENPTGLPQGIALAPILSNLYLLEFDKSCEDENIKLIRYSDDFVVLCKTREEAIHALDFIKVNLSKIDLMLHPDKTDILDPDTGLEYLGKTLLRSSQMEPQNELIKSAGSAKLLSSNITEQFKRNTLYVQHQGCSLRICKGKIVVIKDNEELLSLPGRWIKEVLVFGNCHFTIDCMRYFLSNGVPVFFLANSGRYFGELRSTSHYRVEGRIKQSQKLKDMDFRINLARTIVSGKIRNQIAFLARFYRRLDLPELKSCIDQMESSHLKLTASDNLDTMRGIEGHVSHIFYSGYAKLIRGDLLFEGRSRRPPRDPVNSLLSFGYSLLTNLCSSAIIRAGLDPYIGFMHIISGGMPSLACDLVEEFRTPVVDSLVAYLVNTAIYSGDDFYISKNDGACLMKDAARKRYFTHFENRLGTTFKHPESSREISYRECIDYQAKELRDYLLGHRFEYKPFFWRR